MKTLFEQLSPESQAKVNDFNNIDLTDALNKYNYFIQLDARSLFMMADIFGFNKYDISFVSAMRSISELFSGAHN